MLLALHRLLIAAINRAARLDSSYRERRRLALLDPHILRDIGLTQQQVRDGGPVWNAPDHWFHAPARESFVQDRHDAA